MMREHPYEFGGMLVAIAIIMGIFGGVVGNEMQSIHGVSYDIDSSIHDYIDDGFEKEWTKYIPPPQKPDYGAYYHENQMTMKCKALANDLQEFSDCVNLGFICVEWDNKLKCTLTSGDGGFGSGSGSGSHP